MMFKTTRRTGMWAAVYLYKVAYIPVSHINRTQVKIFKIQEFKIDII